VLDGLQRYTPVSDGLANRTTKEEEREFGDDDTVILSLLTNDENDAGDGDTGGNDDGEKGVDDEGDGEDGAEEEDVGRLRLRPLVDVWRGCGEERLICHPLQGKEKGKKPTS